MDLRSYLLQFTHASAIEQGMCIPRLVAPDKVRVGGRARLWKDCTPFREMAGDTKGRGLDGPTASRSAMACSETAMPPYFHSDPHTERFISKEGPE